MLTPLTFIISYYNLLYWYLCNLGSHNKQMYMLYGRYVTVFPYN